VVDVASDTAGFPYPCRLYRDIVVGTWPERVAASHDGKYVYATLPFSSQVAVIRTSDWTVTALINVGPVPRGVAVRPQGDYVYVANSESNYVSVVDVADCAEVAQIPVGRGPWDVAVSPDGSRLWTTCYYDYRVAAASVPENVLDTTIPLEPFPQGIAISPSGDNVFVVGAGYYLHIIDAQSREVTDSVQLDGYGEYVGALSNDSGVVVSGWRSDWERCSFVERITRESWGWSREYERFTMGSLTLGSVALLPGDGYAFVCGSREVLVLDMRGFMPVAQIPLGTWPSGLAVSPDGRYVYVANDTTVTVIGH
jgi:YVTN family beta-propeller protein